MHYHRAINHKLLARTIGILLLTMSAILIIPIIVSLSTSDGAFAGLFGAAMLMTVIGLLFSFGIGRKFKYDLHERDSFWLTGLVWIVVPFMGTLPYLFTGELDNFVDAMFESVSGFTTTGSSVIPLPENLPPSMLLWRSLTQWIGGMGLILFIVMLMKRLNIGSNMLYSAEFSGGLQRKLHPHIATSVRLMWATYCLLTLILTIILMRCGNEGINSVCLAFSTVSTGGFMPHSAEMGNYNTSTLIVLGVAMFLCGLNVALLHKLLFFKWKQINRNEETRLYAVIFVIAVAIVTLSLLTKGNGLGSSLSYALLHISSTISTCGFVFQEPEVHSLWVSAVTFLLIFIGTCTGSTGGGGIKLKRLIIIFKYAKNYFVSMIHPAVVSVVKIDDNRIPQDYINKIFAFVFLYLVLLLCGAFMLTLCDVSIHDSICMAGTNLSNIGPSALINSMGANVEYTTLPDLGKWTLMGLMLAGRLEIFALLAMLMPEYWRKN